MNYGSVTQDMGISLLNATVNLFLQYNGGMERPKLIQFLFV